MVEQIMRIVEEQAGGQQPRQLKLAIYPSPHDFRYLRGSDPWSWEFHSEVVRATARLLKRRRLKVELVDCTAEGCAAWCEERGMVSDTRARAAYVGSLTS